MLKYQIKKNKIIIDKCEDFDIASILECGQIFSFIKINNNEYIVFSKDKYAHVTQNEFFTEIETIDTDYFVNFFDLKTDYGIIKQKLSKFDFMKDSLSYGSGIRIINNDLLETLVSFVISANNNIPRIKKALFYIRNNAGEKIGDYYAFPTLEKLKTLDVGFFIQAGTGYRAIQIVKLLQNLSIEDLMNIKKLDTIELQKYLISLSGIGPKVADCVMLFACNKHDVFPVDTWIEKIYNDYFPCEHNRLKIRQNLIKLLGSLSGYAQQYMFYFKHEQNTISTKKSK